MTQYIDKSALLEVIMKRRDAALTRQHNLESIGQVSVLDEMVAFELNRIISFIDTLEVKEVDLEEETNKYFADWTTDSEYGDAVKPNCCGCSLDDCKDIAKHFFELGLKAQKGEEV